MKAKLIALILFGAYAVWLVFFSKAKPTKMVFSEPKGATVAFSTSGRSGQVVYTGPEGSFAMYWEFGGGDVIAIIDIPNAATWEAQTRIPLEKRMDILHFIGRKTVEAQTTGGKGTYEIKEKNILIKTR
ncbi:MAG TPA: hypothetical protein PKE06_15155 [Flavilitoribacter sp.]|nr:hypothetical protein [Flavilitoribacter sp.]HMQ89579.1 hypothetical protein [Flavilitoribacter sp.]